MIIKKNVVTSLEMYYLRLEQLKEQINTTVAKGVAGESEELEALLTMSIIQKEVLDIHQCLHVLEDLLERCEDGNL